MRRRIIILFLFVFATGLRAAAISPGSFDFQKIYRVPGLAWWEVCELCRDNLKMDYPGLEPFISYYKSEVATGWSFTLVSQETIQEHGLVSIQGSVSMFFHDGYVKVSYSPLVWEEGGKVHFLPLLPYGYKYEGYTKKYRKTIPLIYEASERIFAGLDQYLSGELEKYSSLVLTESK